MENPWGMFVLVVFVLSGFYSVLARIALYLRFRRKMPGLSGVVATTLFFLEIWYIGNRRDVGSRAMDFMVASLTVSFLVAVACALVLYNSTLMGPMPTHPRGS